MFVDRPVEATIHKSWPTYLCSIHCGVLGATSLATPVTAVNMPKSVYVADKISMEDSVLDHRYAPTAMVLAHLPLKTAQSDRRRKRFRWLVEASLSSVLPASAALSYPIAENVQNYKRLRARTRFVVKEQKKTSWRSVCSKLNSKTTRRRSGKQSVK